MSTDLNTNTDVTTEETLDDFATSFFGENKELAAPAKAEAVEEVEAEVDDASEKQDTHSAEDGATEEAEVIEADPEETDESDKSDKKPNRVQERINEVVAKQRQAERERDALQAKLDELSNSVAKPKPAPADTATQVDGPSPLDKNEDGSDKYPLGEFDPKFVKDTVQHMLNEQVAIQKQEAVEQAKVTEEQKVRGELQNTWNTKLVDVQERYPDFTEKGEQMLSVFEGIDEAYGQYLTDTLMEMDAGPEVFYYLANNLDEATNIVNAGPRKATIALAKLESQLAGTPTTKAPPVKTTKAPPPPPQNKGSAVSKGSVDLDTDDLDAFSKVLFVRK